MKYSKVVPWASIYKITRFYLNIKYKLDTESRELRDLESRGPDVASRA